MRPRTTISTSALALVLVGTVLASATGGAVAGSLITGAQVQNGSLTGKDIKDGSLKTGDLAAKTRTALTGPAGTPGAAGPPGLSGIETVSASLTDVASGAEGSLSKSCPAGKQALGAAAFWDDSSDAVQFVIGSGTGATAYYDNETGGMDDLNLQVRCATVAP